ncbi:hypothetical protein GCM10011610_67000 [Nocardia rhizosphaerihabitans]|uniref:Uncharacterized protein n=1 Tax=Nocardia rhizosphaerihabitans TaxID=1691570 RepID=A0ABQ2L144_9NOCA|nr:hypothetical protein GCM10011610_67000 [Nocardia rhizosphaerihabitans]
MSSDFGNLRKCWADFMTDKAYTAADLGIFGVHPCSLRFFYDLPKILNTCITYLYSWIGVEKAGENVESMG